MDTSRSNKEDRSKIDEGLQDESASTDSTWGEGSASALQTLKKVEERRARVKPFDERPSGD